MQGRHNEFDEEEKHNNFYHYENGNYECKKPGCNVTKLRNPDGTLRLRNPNIEIMEEDVLYHLDLGSGSHNLVEMFGDVKFVCMGGTSTRMESLAHHFIEILDYKLPTGTILKDISLNSQRFAMYKVGPVLCVSHGMGNPSIAILLNEVIKLMYHAKIKDPIFFRIGTCGGIGIEAGTVVISNEVMNEIGDHHYEYKSCGRTVELPTTLDNRLVEELLVLSKSNDSFEIVKGGTMCANDFYEGQGRTDGLFCEYTEGDKLAYLEELQRKGVKNIEMEATAFAAITHHAGIKAALVNVAIINRFDGDQVIAPKEVLMQWQNNPQIVVGRYIKQKLLSTI